MNKQEVSIIPLSNFDSDIESLTLNNRIQLRRIGNVELKRLRATFPSSFLSLLDVKYVLEMDARMQVADTEVIIFQHNLPEVTDTILSLRLLQAGPVQVATAFLIDNKGLPSGCDIPTSHAIPSKHPYFLKQTQIADFKKLWKRTQTVRSDKPYLTLALMQFTKSYDEKTPKEKILDYTIAFESLVFHEENRSIEPAGKVIGIAIGMLLGTNQHERTKIKHIITKAYTVRNATVHGNLKKLKEISDRLDISIETEKYLRLTLRKMVEE